jgi:hypothetical protein
MGVEVVVVRAQERALASHLPSVLLSSVQLMTVRRSTQSLMLFRGAYYNK